jgi:Rieske Fe-S protein
VRLQHLSGRGGSNGHHGDYTIVGGEDHKTGQEFDAQERYSQLAEWAKARFPMMGPIEFNWSGETMEATDRLAFIGASPSQPDGVYVVTGESGVGMTHGTIAASMITDLICGRPNEWAGLYEPTRRQYRAAASYVKENINVAKQYLQWLMPGEVASADEIAPGSGAIIREGLHMLACYRDALGVLHERSAACPHLGCIVQWNDNERTWDCPCHGSRFAGMGTVISGPANRDLAARP